MKGILSAIAAAVTLLAFCVGVAQASPRTTTGVGGPPQDEVLKREPYYLSLHRPDRARPKGTILAIPGGGWTDDSQPGLVEDKMADWIPRLLGLGYQVATVGPRGGTFSIQDSLSAFDLLRRDFPRQGICTLGGSSGGHLALMVAIDRGSEVTCVVDHAGPPNLEQEAEPNRFWPFSFIVTKVREVTKAAIAAFGASQLAALSPINRVADIVAPVFVAAAPCDPYIPMSDQEQFASLLRAAGKVVQLFQLQAGNEAYASHCGVTMSSYTAYEQAENGFLRNYLSAAGLKRQPHSAR